MRRTMMLTLAMVISGIWLRAQEGSPGRDEWIPANVYPPTIQGCLASSNTHYRVIGGDGTIYNLTGDTARLRPYVGHEVEVTGNPTIRTLSTTQKDAGSTAQELPALDVKTVKELSKTCDAAKP